MSSKKLVLCIVNIQHQATEVVDRLKAVGFSNNEISVLFPDQEAGGSAPAKKSTREARSPKSRAAWLAARRSGFATVGTLTVPNVGSFVVAGSVISVFDLVREKCRVARVLTRIGMDEIQASRYQAMIEKGSIMISTAIVNSDQVGLAKEIFLKAGARDVCVTAGRAPDNAWSSNEHALPARQTPRA